VFRTRVRQPPLLHAHHAFDALSNVSRGVVRIVHAHARRDRVRIAMFYVICVMRARRRVVRRLGAHRNVDIEVHFFVVTHKKHKKKTHENGDKNAWLNQDAS
jgi:hypothetical protein